MSSNGKREHVLSMSRALFPFLDDPSIPLLSLTVLIQELLGNTYYQEMIKAIIVKWLT